MKYLQILLISLLSCSVLMAQSDPSPTVFSQVGKAKLVKPGVKKKMKVRAGSALGQEGTLVLKKNTTVGVFFDDGYTYLTGPGTFEVAPLMESSRLEESDFMEILGDKLQQVQHPFFNQSRRSGFGSGGSGGTGSTTNSTTTNSPLKPPSKPTQAGAGDKESGIKPIAPLKGKIAAGIINFSWRPKAGNTGISAYEVVVMNSSGDVVFRQEAKGQSLSVTTAQAGLTDKGKYSWKVSSKGNSEINSGPVEVEFQGADGVGKALDRLSSDKAYQMASPASKLLMEIATLDRLKFVDAAFQRLSIAQKKYKKNPLVKAMSKYYKYDYGILEQ
ncbi:hypothetical protein [Neolewinella agarilytica]|uniref:Fibronectin type-III domain-containing protein n=1 Tax=Neolewinella agarilytica TaxID=478744 RepID=A0A1H9ABJ3_9BACT|nr:hypothetical protein [Neolewinella agarilytica]SEP74132.1 hypothetical protein SAMN05444359_10239 [Neolewinella agarilytica]